MFNYSEIDKHITVADMAIVVAWLLDQKLDDYMIGHIDREKGKRVYNIHLTCAQNGFNRKVIIHDDNKVEVIERENEMHWMS